MYLLQLTLTVGDTFCPGLDLLSAEGSGTTWHFFQLVWMLGPTGGKPAGWCPTSGKGYETGCCGTRCGSASVVASCDDRNSTLVCFRWCVTSSILTLFRWAWVETRWCRAMTCLLISASSFPSLSSFLSQWGYIHASVCVSAKQVKGDPVLWRMTLSSSLTTLGSVQLVPSIYSFPLFWRVFHTNNTSQWLNGRYSN